MSEFYRAKFNELFTEFTRYLITHPDFGEDIPKGAEVILLDRQDPGYTNYMLKKAPKKDVVFIDVGKLAPIRSRLRKPKIISRPPGMFAG
jgi:hypothetical protein